MFAYLDSSVLIKKYFQEDGSNHIPEIWKNSKYLAISQVGYSEILATMNRKQKIDRFNDKIKSNLIRQFKEDWSYLIRINVDSLLNIELEDIHKNHHLRGFDAIHLASAKLLFKVLREDILFLSADVNLSLAAGNEGINTGKYKWK